MEFYEALIQSLKDRSLTKVETADLIGVAPSTLNRWVKGVCYPRLKYWNNIDLHLGIDISVYIRNSFKRELTISTIEVIAENHGGKLVLSTFNSTHSKAKFICSLHGTFWIKPNNVTAGGQWCPKCANVCPNQAAQRFYSNIVESGGIPVEKYINSCSKVLIDCGKNHQFSITPNDIRKGNWCPYCHGQTLEQVEHNLYTKISSRKGRLLSKFINNKTKVNIECEDKHFFRMTPNDVTQNHWCPWCYTISKSNTKLLGVCKYSNEWRAKINSEVLSTHSSPEKAARARDAEVIRRRLHLEPYYYPLNYPVLA